MGLVPTPPRPRAGVPPPRRRPSRRRRAMLPFLAAPVVVVVVVVVASFLLLYSMSSSSTPPVSFVVGLAYAPNFVTKIIRQTAGPSISGSFDVVSPSSSSSDDDDVYVDDDPTTTTTTRRPIITRFPPEPNGYLHLGHAKASSFNFAVARSWHGGRCHMRLDDTNPSREDEEYVRGILEDVRWIQRGAGNGIIAKTKKTSSSSNDDDDGGGGTIDGMEEEEEEEAGPWHGRVRKTSDYFSLMYDAAVYLIERGDAYVDELTADETKEYRGTLTVPGKDSPHRYRPTSESLSLFDGMKAGTYPDGRYTLRAKIDMTSPNLNMRDPVLYRIKHESHQATGDAWCIYPMYDYSHPIADAIEGVTHSLCTLEFEDHRPLYDWVAERMKKGGFVDCVPRQIEFSRLNLKYTVLSKRKLIKLVEEKHVDGWDDPRMPTISGIRRRGFPPSAIRLFCERMGISKSDSNIDFGILEDCAREVLDEECPRAFAILNPLRVTLTNWDGGTSLEDFEVPRHPKRPDLGHRVVPFGGSAYIERSDFFDIDGPEGRSNGGVPPAGFKRLLPGGKVRLKYAYVIRCDGVVRDATTDEPSELLCTVFPETRAGATPEGEARVKGIVQWVEASTCARCRVMQYDRLFVAEEPGRESGDFTADINADSLRVVEDVVVEPSVATDALGMIARIRDGDAGKSVDKPYHADLAYQFERSGYYALDSSSTESDLIFNRVVTLKDTWNAASSTEVHQPTNEQKDLGKHKSGGGGGGGQAPALDDARRIALRVGTILEAGPHPEAESLIVCKLDCGDVDEQGRPQEPRTVVAGLAGKIPYDDLVDRKVVCITNLKPAKMRGIESTAMLLAASDGKEGDEENVQLLDVPASVPNGELLSFEDMEPCEPDAMLKSKGALKVWDRVKARLRVNENGEATYLDEDNNAVVRKILTSDGPVKATSLRNCMIG